MPLHAGSRLGPYEVLGPLGAGGMGEVYRGRDTRLDREVAIKVLPEQLADSPELQQRFEREARAVSSLNHPNVCALFDVGQDNGRSYLVMELVEGESLAQRLAKGPLPPAEVLRLGIEIADGLEAAHRHGIVHRDLKPANIMLTRAGVKILDFGLAKYQEARVDAELSHLTSMATATSPARPLTEEGTILGTYHYMAPEQLEGSEVDARTDLFALGCVLYEMATGRHAFEGRSRASLIGAILRDEPAPISSLQPMTPPALDRLVQGCLAKDPDDRLQTAHDVKLQLEWIAEGGSRAGAPAMIAGRRRSRERLAWGLAGLLMVVAAGLAVVQLRRAPVERFPVRFQLTPSDQLQSIGSPRLSPDGRMLAFSATDAQGTSRIWVRPLGALEARPLPGTEGATLRPFWSPDSRSVAFIADGKLKRVVVAGGPALTICDAPTGADGTWSREGTILFDGTGNDPIQRVPAGGGMPRTAVSAGQGVSLGWPSFLPDGRHFLYVRAEQAARESRVMVAALDGDEAPKALLASDSMAAYAPPGLLLFVRDEVLLAQPFDADERELRGAPVPVVDRVARNSSTGLADFSLSANGTLVYRTAAATRNRLVWLDRNGNEVGEIGPPQEYANTALSPDGSRLAMGIDDADTGTNVWVRDLARGVTSRLTFGPSDDGGPVWSPDGRSVVFYSSRGGAHALYRKPASGVGPAELVWKCDDFVFPSSWSADGRFLAVTRLSPETSWDVWAVPADGSGEPVPVARNTYGEGLPVFSPDGRYIAYQTDETGRRAIYVQEFPGPGGRWQLSAGDGQEAQWSADGATIYYLEDERVLMAVPVETDAGFSAGTPRPLFEVELPSGIFRNRYLVTRDGSRFLVLTRFATQSLAPITVVLNWDAELER